MNRETWAKMIPEERRIKIAELCRITDCGPEDWATCDFERIGCWTGLRNGVEVDCPDYEHDLNAMHEAEELIPTGERGESNRWPAYEANLARVIGYYPYHNIRGYIHATAAQRAEAFALTMEPE
jgi:hypothetical protein